MKKLTLTILMLLLALVATACAGEGTDTTLGGQDTSIASGDEQANPNESHTHDYHETVITASTCSTAGKKAMQCSCGETEQGSEMILPLAAHNANKATCTEDSICSDCGKLLVERYGHFIIDSVVSEADCTNDGLSRSTCNRCGVTSDTVIPKQHKIDASRLVSDGGVVGNKCTVCGEVSGFAEEAPFIFLQFEDLSEAEKYSDFQFAYPVTTTDGGDGAAYPHKAIWMGYDVDKVKSFEKYVISFDFKLTADGLADKGESIFTLIGGVTYKSEKPGTKQDWGWAIKYYEKSGVVATVMQGFNDSNSIKVNKGEWNSFVGIVDNVAHEISVYINGSFIGKRNIHDYNDAAYGGAFCMRFYDASPVNGTSDPMYDNFKIAEIR